MTKNQTYSAPKMKICGVCMPQKMFDKLRAVAEDRQLSLSDTMRQAISSYLDNQQRSI